ncbi:hypothetical protein J2855_001752 [Agrobacterium tumefaciens]|nr:hypothetical protein [Agrobacterium tumefaciens]MBP2517269.1 hypothetical protein [Agrobacterium tumefaciens]MBP2575903.1 hypothetical protein [Agrobacterium tumefaciens]MBP2594259.1 hypothetical protein [Agrobacterium tumefaciens]
MRLIINLGLLAAVVLFALWRPSDAKQVAYLPRLDRPSDTVAMIKPNRPCIVDRAPVVIQWQVVDQSGKRKTAGYMIIQRGCVR